MHIENPADWQPVLVTDLIGPAAQVCRALLAKAARPGAGGMRVLLTGEPGLGKTSANRLIAAALAGNPFGVEEVSGKDVNADTVRQWLRELPTYPMYGRCAVKVIEEFDRLTPDAVVLMLHYLDLVKRTGHRAVLASSNGTVADLDARLQSRCQFFPVAAPTERDIEAFLRSRVGLPSAKAKELSLGCKGDFRGALNDAQSWLDMQRADAIPLTPAFLVAA